MLALATHVHVCFRVSKMDDFSVREKAKLTIWYDTTGSVVQTRRMSMAEFPYLTPCYFFLWGYLKSLVYRQKPRDLEDLKQKITDTCAEI